MDALLNEYSVSVQTILNSNEDNTGVQNVLNNIPIYVIHLNTDVIRKLYITYLFKRFHLNYMLVSVDTITDKTIESFSKGQVQGQGKSQGKGQVQCSLSQFGCVLSHLWCLKHAIANHFPQFIVFEDDVVFHGDFLNRIKKYLNSPFDMVMLGACDFHFHENKQHMNKKWNVYFPKQNALGAHANLYTLSFAKTFYDWKTQQTMIDEFDRNYDVFYSSHKMAICCPNLVVCELSTSNLQHHFGPCDRNLHIVYMKNCFPDGFTYHSYLYITIDFIEYFIKSFMESFNHPKDEKSEKIDKEKIISDYLLQPKMSQCKWLKPLLQKWSYEELAQLSRVSQL